MCRDLVWSFASSNVFRASRKWPISCRCWQFLELFLFPGRSARTFCSCTVLTGEHPDATSRCHCTRDACMCISARNTTLLSSPSQGQRNANELFYCVTRVIALENQYSQVTRDASDLIIYSSIHIDCNTFHYCIIFCFSLFFLLHYIFLQIQDVI